MPVEFLIIKKKNIQKYLTNLPYLKLFVKPVEVGCLPVKTNNDLVCMAEDPDIASSLVDKTVAELIALVGANNIEMIHITDQKTYGSE
jgi:hypothetical protein